MAIIECQKTWRKRVGCRVAVNTYWSFGKHELMLTCNCRHADSNGVTLHHSDIERLDDPTFLTSLKASLRLHEIISYVEALKDTSWMPQDAQLLSTQYYELWMQQLPTIDAGDHDAVLEFCAKVKSSYNDVIRVAKNGNYAHNKPTPRKEKPGYVYLIKSDKGYKIGMSKIPKKRIKRFGVDLPFPIETIALIKCPDMLRLERRLHERFADKRLGGEWFALEPQDVLYIGALQSTDDVMHIEDQS